ncbi:MAG: LPS assembly lipoprotein LptE [Gammaproteobacteria bacterium]|nr:LPS assembly lipoprotein LptE [Gammaproteobacteria bacterium]
MPRPRYLAFVLLFLLLSGCGFHLRGSVVLPQVMARTHIVAERAVALGYELEGMLRAAGGEVVRERAEATAVLTLHEERLGSRVLTLDAQGRASGQLLTLLASYSLVDGAGVPLVEGEGVRIEREYSFDPDNVLAQGGETAQLHEEMRRQAAQQILRRVRALSRLAGQNSATLSSQDAAPPSGQSDALEQ